MIMSNEVLDKLIAFRKYLHKYPELSKKEHATAKKIKEFLSEYPPDELFEGLGGNGLAAVYDSGLPGKSVLFRADIDALPIEEINDFGHKSANPGVSHKCGHDGHTTVLCGLAVSLSVKRPKSGRVILLFQPAEETGEGAKLVLEDPKFDHIKPDYVFAFHNLPGYPLSSIIIRKRSFAAASKGLTVKLFGKTSHAAQPELGISPALAVAEIIQRFSEISESKDGFNDFKLITVVHTKIGEIAFGTSPGYAEVRATLRSFRNDDMDILSKQVVEFIENVADSHGLECSINWQEEFPATTNESALVDLVRKVVHKQDHEIIKSDQPFRWSEDFGYFTNNYPGVLFGIGSGENHPSLHNPDYDFPDGIIKTGILVFRGIISEILE
jgi:amidohydrolase